MYPTFTGEIATQRITEQRQQAARQRVLRQLRAVGAASTGTGRAAGRRARTGLWALPAGH